MVVRIWRLYLRMRNEKLESLIDAAIKLKKRFLGT